MTYSRSRAARAWVLLGGLLLVPLAVVAAPEGNRSVYLNNTNISAVRSQTFENVTVEIDSNGNVLIRSDVYKIETGKRTPTPIPEQMASIPRGMRYWLISEENAPGMSQYDFDVFVNGNLVKTVKSGDPQVIEDITRFVVPGANTATITARKNFGAGRKSESKDYFQRVYIGKGALNDTGAIIIDSPDVDYRKSAADVQNFADQISFTPK